MRAIPTIVAGEVVDIAAPPTVRFSAGKESIISNGTDGVTVAVQVTGADPLPAAIEVTINGSAETVALKDGKGSLGNITASSGNAVRIDVVDKETYWSTGLELGVKYDGGTGAGQVIPVKDRASNIGGEWKIEDYRVETLRSVGKVAEEDIAATLKALDGLRLEGASAEKTS